MPKLKQLLCLVLCDESGATAIEYALLAAFIAGTIVGSVALLGEALAEKYDLVVHLFP
ncbi:MAG: Flp family type IVb pilin [Rhodospirillales bacterium]